MRHLRIEPRWLIGTVLVAAIAVGCISAGLWQLRRLDQRRDSNATIRSRATETVPLPTVGFGPDADVDELVFRQVEVTGTYDRSKELLIRFRTRRGLPGYEVVTPLRTRGGTVLVNRGWVPLDQGERWAVPNPTAPERQVTVRGLLAPPEGGPARISRPATPDRPVVAGAIDPKSLRSLLPGHDLYAVHLLAMSGTGGRFPVPVDPPDLGEGPHRDYAIQWFLFALVGIVGWITLLFRRGPLRGRFRDSGRAGRPPQSSGAPRTS